MMEFNFNSYDDSRQSISYCEVDKCNAVIKLKKCLQEIKQLSNRIINSDDLMLWDVYELNEQIYQKISEVGNELN